MKLRRLLPFLFLLLCIQAAAQPDSSHLRISLLTCSPGAELYSTFGHTAIRVTDSTNGVDMVYNYGTFDDRDPNFYAKFTRGIMLYALSDYSYQDFLREYSYEQRSVMEQELLLSGVQKQRLYAALQENAKEENRYYNYYFHTDNCTTRARDMIRNHTGASVEFANVLSERLPFEKPVTYRRLIHSYLDKANQDWSRFGIDLVLGNNLDEKVTSEQAMFLPDYLMKGVDKATADGHKLAKHYQFALQLPPTPPAVNFLTPLFLFPMIFAIIGLLSFSALTNLWARRILNVFDAVFFLFVGVFGILIVTLWIIRVDTVCRDNFNVIWALPTHFLIAFVVYLKRKWLQTYFRIVFGITLLFTLCWFFIPQQINPAVVPLLGIILMRSYFRGNLPVKQRKPRNTTNIFVSSKTINIEL